MIWYWQQAIGHDALQALKILDKDLYQEILKRRCHFNIILVPEGIGNDPADLDDYCPDMQALLLALADGAQVYDPSSGHFTNP